MGIVQARMGKKGSATRLRGACREGGGDRKEGEVWPRVAVRFLDGGGVKVKENWQCSCLFFALHVTSMYF